jgi:SAM-dependent methyltransferase
MTDKGQIKISNRNQDSWNDNQQVSKYIKYHSNNKVQDSERAILDQIKDNVRGEKILELGIGTGRLVRELTQISEDYIGIDYSRKTVDFCKENYPEVKFYCQDARDLSFFDPEQFTLVIFAHNGIDNVGDIDRRKIISEAYRLLKQGGCFVFSSHNLEWLKHHPMPEPARLSFPRPRISRNPFNSAVQMFHSLTTFYGLLKADYQHKQNKKLERFTDQWAIINEPTYGYVFLQYHTTIRNQIRQLKECGFSNPVYVFDRQGIELSADLENSESAWIYYYTRR